MDHLLWLIIAGFMFVTGFILGAIPQVKRELRKPPAEPTRLLSVFKENGMIYARYSNGVVVCIAANGQTIPAENAEKSRLDSLN